MSSEDEKKSNRSSETSSSDDSVKPKRGKKRRRIKTAGTDSDEDGSDKVSCLFATQLKFTIVILINPKTLELALFLHWNP